MKEITKLMIKKYELMKLGYDFMGYDIINKNNLSFHHLIIPHRDCRAMGLGEGYLEWNGAILNQNTSHNYLHLIEAKDYDMFLAITNELIDENIKGHLDIDNLRRIHDILECFERENINDKSKKGNILIKQEYMRRRKF